MASRDDRSASADTGSNGRAWWIVLARGTIVTTIAPVESGVIDDILVPYDDSGPAQAALPFAIEEFQTTEITVLAVIDTAEVRFGPDAPHTTSVRRRGRAELRADR